jgi:3-oxoacyl-[acyl-carrier-protein] synthase III
MRFDDVHVLGVATEYGRIVPATQAVANGEYDEEWRVRTGYISAAVSERAAPELAVAAARRALAAAGLGEPEKVRGSVGLHLHACVYHQGVDLWPASCYILNQLGGGGATLSCQVDAMSNSAMAAFDLAASALSGRSDLTSALVTTGDRFCEPGFRRWANERNVVWGDAGTAIVLGRGAGIARLVACASASEPVLEGMARGNAPFEPASTLLTKPAVMERRKREFADRHGGMDQFIKRSANGTTRAVGQVLAEANLKMDDVRWVLTPFFGIPAVRRRYLEPLGIGEERTLTGFGLTVGHLGPSDPIAGLTHLVGEGLVDPGDHVLVLGMGAGTTWTPAVLQITT